MIQVIEILEKIKAENNSLMVAMKSQRLVSKIKPDDFKDMFFEYARKELLKRNQDKCFVVDDSNKDVINQLYYYLTGSSQFDGDIYKGILLAGSIGTGKSIIMNAFCNIYEELTAKLFFRTHAKRIPELLRTEESGFFDKRPMFIDDLGREPKEVNNYGTKELPTIDLMSIRYDYGALTFATTNFNNDVLKQLYGEAIIDRFKEMFNTIVLKGSSKRN